MAQSDCSKNAIYIVFVRIPYLLVQLSIDETKDKDGRHVAAIIVRDFEEECSKPYLIYVVELSETNSTTIKLAVDDAIKKLGEGCDRNNLLVLVTDAAKYMIKAGKYLSAAAHIFMYFTYMFEF